MRTDVTKKEFQELKHSGWRFSNIGGPGPVYYIIAYHGNVGTFPGVTLSFMKELEELFQTPEINLEIYNYDLDALDVFITIGYKWNYDDC